MSDHFGGRVRFSSGCIILVGDHFSGTTFSPTQTCIILVVQIFLYKNAEKPRKNFREIANTSTRF